MLYGGTGLLLSRGLLNAIPAKEWMRCARRLVCGAGAHRLLTCVTNLLPAVCVVRMTENEAFMRAALDKPGNPRTTQCPAQRPLPVTVVPTRLWVPYAAGEPELDREVFYNSAW